MWPSWSGSPPRLATPSPGPVVRGGRRDEGVEVNGQGARVGDRRPGALHRDRCEHHRRTDPHRGLHPARRPEVMTATGAGRPELVPPAAPGFSPVTGKEEVTSVCAG